MTPRVVLVTGASSGIGAACAIRLARAGHHVIGASRSGTELGAPPQISARILDIRDSAAIDRTVTGIVADWGRLDAVVNAAGIAVGGPLEDTPAELVRAQLETGLMGTISLIQSAAPFLRRFAPSRFVHISSIAAHVALPYQSLYCASHFGVSGLLQSLRYELAPQGVRVILVEPGSVRTSLTANRRRIAGPKAYGPAATAALDVNDADERRGVEADRIARVVERILTMSSPPDRRSAGHWHERITIPAQRFLPAGVFRRIIQSHFRIGD